jgi:uroporphyrinogen decarboxylase
MLRAWTRTAMTASVKAFAKSSMNMRVAPMNSRFLDACRRRPTDVRPVWFMRQAGRYMKQYRDIRAKHGILEICKRPDLAAQVTLQPVEILDVDAAIIFADLLLPVEPMGLKLRFATGEGPMIDNPVRTSSDIDSLSISNTDDLGYVGETIQMVVKALAGRVPGDRIRGRAVHHGQLHD